MGIALDVCLGLWDAELARQHLSQSAIPREHSGDGGKYDLRIHSCVVGYDRHGCTVPDDALRGTGGLYCSGHGALFGIFVDKESIDLENCLPLQELFSAG